MTEILPAASQDTVTTLAFGRKVLMIGTGYGQDFLALANSAQILAAFTLPAGGNAMQDIGRTAALAQQLAARGQATHVLLHSVDWREGLGTYLVDQFDLAVLNPHALGEDDPRELIAAALQYAGSLVVVEPPGANLWDVVTGIAREHSLMCTADGSVIVARPMPTEPKITREG